MARRHKKLWIEGVEYTVEEVALRAPDGNQVWGWCSPANSKTIKVHRHQTGLMKADALLHEVVHACWHEARIGGRSSTEERVVSRLVPFLVSTLRSNPWLVEYLQQA